MRLKIRWDEESKKFCKFFWTKQVQMGRVRG